MKNRIYLVDDHPVVRQGYTAIIDRDDDFEVCGEADTALKALEEIPDLHPDLVIVDLTMEGMNGIELIKRLRSEGQEFPVLVISIHDEDLYAVRALHAGADGYIMKAQTSSTLLEAIRSVLDGEVYVSEGIMQQMLLTRIGRGADKPSALGQLSDRELEVFEYIGQGLSTQEIADEMFISPKTVGTHRRHIKDKLSIDTNARLRQRAVLWVEEQA